MLVPGAAFAASHISTVRVTVARDHTRIVLESSVPIRFSAVPVTNSERLIFDLDGIELSPALIGLVDKIGADHPYIKPARIWQASGNTVRLEFDFRVAVEARVFTLGPAAGYGYRLVFSIFPVPRENSRPEEMWLAVRINRQEPAETALFLRRNDGKLLARAEDLRGWRLRLPTVAPLLQDGESYYPLDALQGLSYELNEARQELMIEAAPDLFEATTLAGPAGDGSPLSRPATLGGFFNYDVFADHKQGLTTTSGLFELGGFGGWGTGISGFLARDPGDDDRFIRLDTTWTYDRPASLDSLRFGDAIGRASGWRRPVRFGGMQWATNFATQPDFITFPLPSVSGEAALPSSVDLYVEDALRLRQDVPSGPFSIQNVPVVTGRGEVRMVVRDTLGREQIVTQPYYASPTLLKQGLHDYAYEMGWVRENFEIASNDYGRFLATGTHRLGFTDRFTGEVQGEFLRDQQTVGIGGTFLWPAIGVFSTSFAGSHSDQGEGGLLALGFDHQSRRLSFGGSTQLTSEHFTQLGLQPGAPAPRQLSRAFVGLAFGGYGSLGVAYANQDFRDREPIELVSANYNLNLGNVGLMSLSALQFLGGEQDSVVGVTFTLPLGKRTSASMNTTRQQSGDQASLQIQRALPAGSGVGYRLLADTGTTDRRQASISAQTGMGAYTVEAAQSESQTGFRGSVSGGVALIDSDVFLSRRITDSFAVVQVADYPNVRVYADNQLVARTDTDGRALVPRLRSYQKNSIRIDPADLPLDAQVDALQIDVMPYFRNGQLVRFPVTRVRGALLKIVTENGQPLPSGAIAQLLGKEGGFPAAYYRDPAASLARAAGEKTEDDLPAGYYRDSAASPAEMVGEQEEFPVALGGEVYLTGLAANNRVRVTWRGRSCEFAVYLPDTTEPLPHLGTYTCLGVKP